MINSFFSSYMEMYDEVLSVFDLGYLRIALINWVRFWYYNSTPKEYNQMTLSEGIPNFFLPSNEDCISYVEELSIKI